MKSNKTSLSLAGLLTAFILLAPALARAQEGRQAPAASHQSAGSEAINIIDFHLPPHFDDPSVQLDQNAPDIPRTTIPFWTNTFVANGHTYVYAMVGTDPSKGSKTTTVTTPVIPVKLIFANGAVSDPTAVANGNPASALNLTLNSPIFQNAPIMSAGTFLGNTQYVDGFQRGNFWNFVSTVSPNYHVLVAPNVLPLLTLRVPAQFGSTQQVNGVTAYFVDLNFFNASILGMFGALGLTPNQFPMFLTYNTGFVINGSCCAIGYHTAVGPNIFQAQTYAVNSYDDAALLPTAPDISVIAHEVGEWMDDPFVQNHTPFWQAGQVQNTCSNLLEVGDPLSGTVGAIPLNGFNYHPQDLAFLPWFAQQAPSVSVNGFYDLLGVFATFSACPIVPPPPPPPPVFFVVDCSTGAATIAFGAPPFAEAFVVNKNTPGEACLITIADRAFVPAGFGLTVANPAPGGGPGDDIITMTNNAAGLATSCFASDPGTAACLAGFPVVVGTQPEVAHQGFRDLVTGGSIHFILISDIPESPLGEFPSDLPIILFVPPGIPAGNNAGAGAAAKTPQPPLPTIGPVKP